MHDLWVQFHVLIHVITMSSALGSDMDVYLAHLPIAHVPGFTAAADLPKLAYR